MTHLRISDAAELLGVSDDTLRRWADQGRLQLVRGANGRAAVDGAELAALARELADAPDPGGAVRSARNTLRGIVTKVTRDTVMAQVELQAGPFRVVSLLSREAADEMALEVGTVALASIKATNVVIELDEPPPARREARAGAEAAPEGSPRPLGRVRAGRAPRALALAVLAAALLAGCGGQAESSVPAAQQDDGGVTGTVDVFAAASLTEAFERIADDFEQAHPGTTVVLNLGASSALAQQIVSGAPADVFAAASPATMKTVTDAGDASDPEVFARNALEIAVPPDNPGRVAGLADLADPERTIALCAAAVPCGAAAEQVFAAAGLRAAPDTLEQDVKAALAKVRLGEVDAALVYRTDVLSAGDEVEGIAFPEAEQAVNDYPVAALTDAPDADAAAAFVDHVLSESGQQVLADAGFLAP